MGGIIIKNQLSLTSYWTKYYSPYFAKICVWMVLDHPGPYFRGKISPSQPQARSVASLHPKRSTFSHKMHQKWGFCGRLRGWGDSKRSTFWGCCWLWACPRLAKSRKNVGLEILAKDDKQLSHRGCCDSLWHCHPRFYFKDIWFIKDFFSHTIKFRGCGDKFYHTSLKLTET